MAGKGSKPRKVNGSKYRDNFEAIHWSQPQPKWGYLEESKTKARRIAALELAVELGLQPESKETTK